ncbi:class E sortase [Streptomyces sp. NPDC057638]|uniref:class E sortase n=1 Tax=Streptomyces sp. NPDC057638 TaxID=3346190 RepID=UPI0036A6BDE4
MTTGPHGENRREHGQGQRRGQGQGHGPGRGSGHGPAHGHRLPGPGEGQGQPEGPGPAQGPGPASGPGPGPEYHQGHGPFPGRPAPGPDAASPLPGSPWFAPRQPGPEPPAEMAPPSSGHRRSAGPRPPEPETQLLPPVAPLAPPGPLPPEAPLGAPGVPAAPGAPGVPAAGPLPGPGRAERRRAAKGRGRGRPRPPHPRQGPGAPSSAPSGPPRAPGAPAAPGAPERPLTRVEARRAAKAAKDSPAVVASRALGELFITLGVVMLLFVTYQLWWTNIRAGQEVDQERGKIEAAWADGRRPDPFTPGQGFALLHIPKLDVVVPVASGIDKERVLDRGMAGHYAEGRLKTALPSDRRGNFAVAGHRNTHGEPFRYINRLQPGDPIVVETQEAYYTYEMASILPQTEPSNIAVISPVPPGSGFATPGRYITLTTCTPEFTSTYRMIVWGKMVEERPRTKGKPDALVG